MTIASVVLPLAFAGLSSISLSVQRYARDAGLAGTPAWLRGFGWCVLMASLAAAMAAPDWPFALVEWAGLAAVAAGLVALVLHWRPRTLPLLASAGGAVGGIAFLWLAVA